LDSGIIAFQKTEEDDWLSNFVSLMSKIEEPKKTEESPQIEEDSCEWI
jgi:hypothetical protein